MINEKRINNISNIIWNIITTAKQIKFLIELKTNDIYFDNVKTELEKVLILNKQMLNKFIKNNNLIYLTN